MSVPWPDGAFKTGTLSRFVGNGNNLECPSGNLFGPYFFIPVFLQTFSSCSQTDFRASNLVDDKRIRAFCIFMSPMITFKKLRGSFYFIITNRITQNYCY